MWKFTRILHFAALAALLAACSVNPVPEPPQPNDSIVFGHIDMDDAPVNLHWLTIRQFKPPTDKPFWSAGVDDGTFYNWYLDPGSYAVTEFGGSGYSSRYTFNVPRQLSAMRIVIAKPGVYFLGSYKYKNVKTGFFEPGKFNLEKVDSPTEKELVDKLLILVKGTPVEPKLQAYRRRLK